jgi:hypothetical protein
MAAAGKPLVLQLQVSWAAMKEGARLETWERWRNAAAPPTVFAELKRPHGLRRAHEKREARGFGQVHLIDRYRIGGVRFRGGVFA